MRKKFGREIALLTLPMLIIGGVAFWKTRAPRDISVPPANIESGAPRVEWNGFRAATVTPAEIGRGLTAKLETTLWSGGQMPPLSRNRLFFASYDPRDQNLRLVYRQKKRWKAYVAPDGTSGIRRQISRDDVPKGAPQPKRANWKTTLWLPLSALPQGAADVHLKGQWRARWVSDRKVTAPASLAARGKWNGFDWSLDVAGKPFDVPLRSIQNLDARAGIVPEVSRTPAVTLLKAEVESLPHDMSADSRRSAAGDAKIILHLAAPWANVRGAENRPDALESRLFDQHGREWTRPAEGLHQPNWGVGRQNFGGERGLPNGEFRFESQISLSHIPASAGTVRLKMWMSDNSQSWPLTIEREVRPKWVLARASHLQIESARVMKQGDLEKVEIKPNTVVDKWIVRPKVEIVVRYTGEKRPIPRGFTMDSSRKPIREFWMWQPIADYDSPEFRRMVGDPMPITPRDDELLFHWSQRVENARGREVRVKNNSGEWDGVIGQPDRPKRLDRQGKRWLLRYDLSGLPRRKKGEKWWFRAQVGIAGEGFVPVEVPLDNKALG